VYLKFLSLTTPSEFLVLLNKSIVILNKGDVRGREGTYSIE
jgi:hypothetical protein